jgi:hypothetical protein
MNTTLSRLASRQRAPRLVAALFTLALSTACAFDGQTPLEEDVETNDSEITNAYVDGPPFIVNLGGCTGTAISSNYIITAAHCFGASSFFSVNIRSGLGSETSAFWGTAQVVVHPNWVSGAANRESWDIAVVRLFGSGLGSSFPRARIYAGPETPWTSKGGTFYVAGYGRGSDPGGSRDCSGADGGGTWRRGGNFAFLGAGQRSGSTWLSVHGYSSLRTTCPGDSGAPYILPRNGVDFAFAVHSRSANVAKGTIRATMLQPKMDWILTTAANMGAPLTCPLVRDHRTSPAMHYYECR